MTLMPAVRNSSPDILSPSQQTWFAIGLYILIIILSYFAVIHSMPENIIIGDQEVYLKDALKIAQQGLSVYVPRTSSYGYPLFLATVLQLTEQFNLPFEQTVFLLQFGVHCLTSFLGLSILLKLRPGSSMMLYMLAFTLIQGNPVTLALTRLYLTDSFTIFPVTLLLWCVVYQPRHKYLLAGFAIGLAIALRPFNQVWFFAWVGGCVVLIYLRIHRMRRRPVQVLRDMWQANWRQLPLRVVFFLIPLVGLLLPQVILIYQAEGRVALSSEIAGLWVGRHVGLGAFIYKYETITCIERDACGIYYYQNSSIFTRIIENAATGSVNIIELPLAMLSIPLIKLGGIFQNYEWSVYRVISVNQVNEVFLWGAVILFLYIYLLQSFLSQHRQRLSSSRPLITVPQILFLGISAYIWLYVIMTAPEGRFVVPVIPGIVALGLYRIADENNPRRIGLIAITTGILYAVTFIILADSIHIDK